MPIHAEDRAPKNITRAVPEFLGGIEMISPEKSLTLNLLISSTEMAAVTTALPIIFVHAE